MIVFNLLFALKGEVISGTVDTRGLLKILVVRHELRSSEHKIFLMSDFCSEVIVYFFLFKIVNNSKTTDVFAP